MYPSIPQSSSRASLDSTSSPVSSLWTPVDSPDKPELVQSNGIVMWWTHYCNATHAPASGGLKVVCEKAEIHPVTYYDYVRQGRAPRPRKGVPRAEALAWLESLAEVAKARAAKASAAVQDIGNVREGDHG